MWTREQTAGQIASAFDVSWPAISQNLRVLRESGLVTERRDGTSRLYRADRAALKPLETYLRGMWARDIDSDDYARRLTEIEATLRSGP